MAANFPPAKSVALVTEGCFRIRWPALSNSPKRPMTPFQIIAAVVTLSAIGAYINNRYFRFPQTIGLMAFAFAVSLVTIILSRIGLANLESLGRVVGSIDFSDVLLHGMLSFLSRGRCTSISKT